MVQTSGQAADRDNRGHGPRSRISIGSRRYQGLRRRRAMVRPKAGNTPRESGIILSTNKVSEFVVMRITDPRVDAYIDKSNDFAKPILFHLRDLIHKACPDVTETLKWSMPSFEYRGILCGFAAFKQ